MTCIVNFKTKKEMKEHIEEKGDCTIDDPSVFSPYYGSLKSYLESYGLATFTNHPKRSWFGNAKLKDGKIIIS